MGDIYARKCLPTECPSVPTETVKLYTIEQTSIFPVPGVRPDLMKRGLDPGYTLVSMVSVRAISRPQGEDHPWVKVTPTQAIFIPGYRSATGQVAAEVLAATAEYAAQLAAAPLVPGGERFHRHTLQQFTSTPECVAQYLDYWTVPDILTEIGSVAQLSSLVIYGSQAQPPPPLTNGFSLRVPEGAEAFVAAVVELIPCLPLPHNFYPALGFEDDAVKAIEAPTSNYARSGLKFPTGQKSVLVVSAFGAKLPAECIIDWLMKHDLPLPGIITDYKTFSPPIGIQAKALPIVSMCLMLYVQSHNSMYYMLQHVIHAVGNGSIFKSN